MSLRHTSRPGPELCLCGSFCSPSGQAFREETVAVGQECRAFRLWVDGLPEEGHEALMQLRQHGFAYDLDRLEADLRHALRTGPAGPISRLVGQRLLALLAARDGASCFLLEEGMPLREPIRT